MKLVGEKAIGSFLVELEKDNLKMAKIKECCEKAVITVKAPTVKKERPTTAPGKTPAVGSAGDGHKSAGAPKAAKRPASECLTNLLFLNATFFMFSMFMQLFLVLVEFGSNGDGH